MNKLTPNLMVNDVRETVEYYSAMFGFELVMAVPSTQDTILNALDSNKEIVYALVKNGSVEIMFQSAATLRADVPALNNLAIGASATIYIEVDNLDDLYESTKTKVHVLKDPSVTWYGVKEYYIQDINGYVVTFAQAAPKEHL